MFETLTDRLQNVFKQLSRRGRLSEKDVEEALREVRLALLEADVHFSVVKDFLGRVKERAVGHEVSAALNPAQQVIKIVHEELLATLGEAAPINISGQPPRVILLVGLQGSGKTTMSAKLASKLKSEGHKPLLVAADPYRPAAADQLETLGKQIDVPVFRGPEKPPELCARAVAHAKSIGRDVVILDTAGRLQIDEALMNEVKAVKAKTSPKEVLLVADAMTGQEAVRIAKGFNEAVGITGLVLTKIDGDARGGAAISMRSVTGVPIKYLGTSEKLDGIEVFTPERLAGRILGMGDVLGLIEKAEAAYDAEQAEKMAEKLQKAEFDFEDFLAQMQAIKKMGSMRQLLEMLPGQMGGVNMREVMKATNEADMDKGLKRTEAIILSMTVHERRNPKVMNASRKRRIAAGAGVTVQDVNRLLKQFRDTQEMLKRMQKTGGKGMFGSGRGGPGGLGGLFGRR